MPVQAHSVAAWSYLCSSSLACSNPCLQDGDFSEKRFRDIVNAALANDIGNLLNRTLNLLKKNCGGTVPADCFNISETSPVRQLAQQQVVLLSTGSRARYLYLGFIGLQVVA